MKKLDQGHDYYDAVETGKEGVVDVNVSLEKRESFEQTYAKLLKHQKENPSEVTENVISWFEMGGKKLERFDMYRFGEQRVSFKEFSEKLKSDDAFLEEAVSGDVKIFDNYSGSYSVVQDKGDILNLPQFKTDFEKMSSVDEKSVFKNTLDFIDQVESESWVFLKTDLKDSRIHLDRVLSGDSIDKESANQVIGFMKSVASTETAKKSLSVDFMDHLDVALKKATQDKSMVSSLSDVNTLNGALNLMKKAEENVSKEESLEMRGGRLALEEVLKGKSMSEKSWSIMSKTLDKAYEVNDKPDMTSREFDQLKSKFAEKYVSLDKKQEKDVFVR